ncbi:MAG: hypothetical protein HN350_13650 [Phycisphaerales bacterium]|jgi:hypothetical protein|nr:hypothetical protein [Phycisphaerales bacterium]
MRITDMGDIANGTRKHVVIVLDSKVLQSQTKANPQRLTDIRPQIKTLKAFLAPRRPEDMEPVYNPCY